jgi:hypothetical protein
LLKTGTVLLLVLLGACGFASEPQLRIGGRATLHLTGFRVSSMDTAQGLEYRMTYDDPYWALGLEAEYGPVWLFRARLDLAEARLFTEGAAAVAVFPAIGLDLMFEPPVRWRLVPYLWGGGQVTRYIGYQDTLVLDPRFITGTERHLRAGLGARFTVNAAVDVFSEVQLFNEDTYAWIDARDHEAGHWRVGSVGLGQAHLGVRFAVSRRTAD